MNNAHDLKRGMTVKNILSGNLGTIFDKKENLIGWGKWRVVVRRRVSTKKYPHGHFIYVTWLIENIEIQ